MLFPLDASVHVERHLHTVSFTLIMVEHHMGCRRVVHSAGKRRWCRPSLNIVCCCVVVVPPRSIVANSPTRTEYLALHSLRWWSSWTLLTAIVVLLALYAIWIPLTLLGRIPDKSQEIIRSRLSSLAMSRAVAVLRGTVGTPHSMQKRDSHAETRSRSDRLSMEAANQTFSPLNPSSLLDSLIGISELLETADPHITSDIGAVQTTHDNKQTPNIVLEQPWSLYELEN